MLRSTWHPGPATATTALIAITDFHAHRRRDLLSIAQAGRDLAASWSTLPGAIGMWLWAMPLSGRSGSVSVWESEEALTAFVRWPPHVQVVRRFHQSGTLHTHRWWTQEFTHPKAWKEAATHLKT
ncbi:hypothetical protein GCM10010492_60320 [Saccharothrix mutabilis subsp. mutabilis]|uniref:DUF3291 domain-containing protein n=1 Tax=Saccharothrix mutabilis subsp. mutabilis TaxID=66855 RepID=A0ABP3E6X3_9PSEU